MVDVNPGGVLEASARPGQFDRGQGHGARGARGARGRRGLRALGGEAPAHRGGMGIRRARRARAPGERVGERADRPQAREHLARPLPRPQHRRGWLRARRAGEVIPAERVRALRHGGQRVGVVQRPLPARRLRPARPGGGRGRHHGEPARAGRVRGSAQPACPRQPRGARRVIPLQRLVLRELPPGRAHEPDARHRDAAPGVPLREGRGGAGGGSGPAPLIARCRREASARGLPGPRR